MTNSLVDWFNTLPTAILLLSALFGVGWLVLRAAGMRGIRPVALAPTISALILTADGLFQAAVGRPWGWIPVMVTTAILALVASTMKRLIDRWDPGILLMPEDQREGMTMRTDGGRAERRLFLTVLVFWAVTALPVILTIPPNAVSQSGDALYHYMQVAIIEREDYASMFNPNAGMFGLTSHAGFYPIVWHQVASLGAWSWRETLIANNVLLLAVALVWYLGLVYLARTALPKVRQAPYLALAASLLAPVFPWRLTYGAALWPYCMAVATCPAVIAMSIECWRRARTLLEVAAREQNTSVRGARARAAMALSAIIPFFVGSCLIHTSAAAMLLWPLLGIVLCYAVRSGARSWRAGRRPLAAAWWIGAVLVVVALVAFVFLPGPQQHHFGRYTELDWSNPVTKLLIPIALNYFGGWATEWIELPLTVLSLLGAAICLWRRRNWELVVAWVFSMSLILAAIAPIPVLSSITGLFYRNPHRLKAMTAVLAVLLVVVTLDALRTWLTPVVLKARSGLNGAFARVGLSDSTISVVNRVAAACIVVVLCTPAMVVGSQAIASDVREGYLPVHGDTRFIADKAELDMIRRLPEELPDDAVVIGDPVAGTGYIPILTGMRSVWVFPGQAADDADGIYLREHFKQIRTDPHVCEILKQHGIRYFYADKDIRFNNSQLSKIRPGLYGVDTSSGFTLIDSGGSASLWRIDICG
ncbi:DUF6541 family protein [Actinomyces oris]|uniref:Tat pathway signal sequence n=1 Tax=Actinomyces oris TaxID=544580 RepID=A0A1Q8VWE2_9ACTO|nr:DUF6541 family protein [Actinomyces oris]OLL14405.1 Tat pathway signal sequence [Actinomyces oris]OLO52587.1 Tat pathway signal sequence [Actinomyces oris]